MNDEYALDSYNTVNTTAHNSSAFPFLEMGTSFVIGLAVGYFLKKFFKLFLLLTGLALVVLFVLESKGTIHVDDKMIESGVSSGIDSFQGLVAMVKDRLSNMTLSSGAGAVAGFFAGIKLG